MGRKRKNEDAPELEMVADIDDSAVEVAPVVIKGPKVSFSSWVDKRVKAGKLKAHQVATVQVFFRKQGLTEFETADDFNQAFARF